jgi:hypothetical protein
MSMNKSKLSYIVQSAIGLAVWIGLTVVVTLRVAQAEQLAYMTKMLIWSFLWGLVLCFISILARHYQKVTDRELD